MNSASCPPGLCCLEYDLLRREKGFILDGVAAYFTAKGYHKTNPKRCDVIPPYNGQTDPYTMQNFQNKEMQKLLKKTNQDHGGTSTNGWLVDYFYKHGPAQRYLSKRNAYGAGHSHDQIIGHRGFLSDLKPIVGYNGKFGFRRNIPSLRQKPSNFGEVTNLSLY
ncbi:sperm microtubule associated protein 1-like [Heptranchias perlo]|uniref:sperm microtubule associated protein 1-like n=1 Tax=Heptranchias perlo TaxID=212740 RepID=UPI00355AA956